MNREREAILKVLQERKSLNLGNPFISRCLNAGMIIDGAYRQLGLSLPFRSTKKVLEDLQKEGVIRSYLMLGTHRYFL
jgi:hypothetical protein